MNLQPNHAEAYELFHNGIIALAKAQEQGMRIDVDYCEKKKKQLTKKIERHRAKFKESELYRLWQETYKGKTNMDSNTQLATILYSRMGLKPYKTTKTGRGSTDEEALSKLEDDVPELKHIFEIKKLTKLRDTYIEAFLREQIGGVLRPFFNLHTTKTYRSCLAYGTDVLVVKLDNDQIIKTFTTKKIENVKKGEFVWSFIPPNSFVTSEVLWAGKTGDSVVYELAFQNIKTKEIQTIRATATHLFLVKEMRLQAIRKRKMPFYDWIPVHKLKVNETVIVGCDSKIDYRRRKEVYEQLVPADYILLSKTRENKLVPVYDLETDITHRFLANKIAVHNSSERINFQNIPKRDKEAMELTRKAIYPRPEHQLMEADFSSMEVRISCVYNKDPKLIQYVTNPTSDMHGDMAEQIFMLDKYDSHIPGHKILRQAAKNGFVFPQFYGDYYVNCAENAGHKWGKLPKGKWKKEQGIQLGDSTLAEHLMGKGIKDYRDFEEHMKQIERHFWGKRFKVYNAWKEKWWESYQEKGYIDLLTGFRRTGVMTKNECINTPIQGTAFHCLLWSFIEIDKIIEKEKLQTRLIGQIHDSMVFDVYPPELEYITKVTKRVCCHDIRETWKWLSVPLEVDIELYPVGSSWYRQSE